jgi:hypothetical protein
MDYVGCLASQHYHSSPCCLYEVGKISQNYKFVMIGISLSVKKAKTTISLKLPIFLYIFFVCMPCNLFIRLLVYLSSVNFLLSPFPL